MDHGYYVLGDFPQWQIREDVPIGTVARITKQLETLKVRKGDFGQLKAWYGACDSSMVERALTGADIFAVPDMFCNVLKYFGQENGELRPGAQVFKHKQARRHAMADALIADYAQKLESFRQRGGQVCSMLELEILDGQLPSVEGGDLVIPSDSFLIAHPAQRRMGSYRMAYGGIIRVNMKDRNCKVEPFEINHLEMCDQRYVF